MVDRGFSFKAEVPLDMRMDPGHQTLTAAEVIATYDEADLTRIIRDYGEERWASRIAAFITAARARRPVVTSEELVEVIKAAIPASARRSGGHPAKKTFQALRIEVNDELGVLRSGLESAIRWLRPSGRVAVLSYHSLEDRIVKQLFVELSRECVCPQGMPVCTCDHVPVLRILTRKALVPSADEIESNPRARSAKLRVAEKV
jgi:16S rRNA (cytosine1402-N4)-methyltransferase